jgi:hypothetical protein
MIGCNGLPGFFISNGKKVEESKIGERQKESVCERLSFAARERKQWQ